MNVSFVDVPCLWIPEPESFKKWYQLHCCATFFIIMFVYSFSVLQYISA